MKSNAFKAAIGFIVVFILVNVYIFSHGLSSKMGNVLERVDKLTSSAGVISSKTDDLSVKTNDISKSTKNLSAMVSEVTRATNDLSQKTESLSAETKALTDKTNSLTDKTNSLTEITNKLAFERGEDSFDKYLSETPTYSKFNWTVSPNKKRVNLLLIISSAPKRSGRRQGIRETWWQQCKSNDKVSKHFINYY